jgi:hypothetical protein
MNFSENSPGTQKSSIKIILGETTENTRKVRFKVLTARMKMTVF